MVLVVIRNRSNRVRELMKVISCLQGFLDSSVIVLYKKLGNMQEQLFYFF